LVLSTFAPTAHGDGDAGLQPFSPAAAAVALNAVLPLVEACARTGLHGAGYHAKVTFMSSGMVVSVNVDLPANLPDVQNACVVQAFSVAHMSPFSGHAVTVGKTFNVP
jgi:hypothetical protein